MALSVTNLSGRNMNICAIWPSHMAYMGVAMRALDKMAIVTSELFATHLELRLFPVINGNIHMCIYREHMLKLTFFFFSTPIDNIFILITRPRVIDGHCK